MHSLALKPWARALANSIRSAAGSWKSGVTSATGDGGPAANDASASWLAAASSPIASPLSPRSSAKSSVPKATCPNSYVSTFICSPSFPRRCMACRFGCLEAALRQRQQMAVKHRPPVQCGRPLNSTFQSSGLELPEVCVVLLPIEPGPRTPACDPELWDVSTKSWPRSRHCQSHLRRQTFGWPIWSRQFNHDVG